MRRFARTLGFTPLLLALGAGGCDRYIGAGMGVDPADELIEVTAFRHPLQTTGVAVSSSGRIFVNSPLWHDDHVLHVAEVVRGEAVPYPSEAWNSWRLGDEPPGLDRFVCVQAVHVDARDRLWVVDAASPKMQGVVPGCAKLVQFDLAQDKPVRAIVFDADVAPPQSYLNDVRVDVGRNAAFLTDSGLGAIIVVDLGTGEARRLLADHPSTKAEAGFTPVVGGRPLTRPDGSTLEVHSDGVALDARNGWLYYQALTGRTLHRVPVEVLLDSSLSKDQVASRVESLGESVVTDGMEADNEGNVYFTALERDSIMRRTSRGAYQTLAARPSIAWPDSFAWGPRGWLYFTTSQIHRTAWFSPDGSQPREPYRVFTLRPPH